jgi:putative tryptophan/tyrosine transport system substrate-binding protein
MPRAPSDGYRTTGANSSMCMSKSLINFCAPWLRRTSAVIALLASLHALPVSAAEVLVVRASDAEPYTQAETALRDRLTAQHQTVRSLLARDVSEKGIEASIEHADIVVAIGTPAAQWLHKNMPGTVRLVYCMVTNAADAGLLTGHSSLGVTTDVSIAEQIKLITEALPRARTIGMLYRSDTREGVAALQLLSAAIPSGWHVEAVAVNESPSIAAAIESLTQKSIDLIWTTGDQKLYDTAAVRSLLLSALRNKIPVWGFSPAFVRAGALIGVGVEPSAQGIQAADLTVQMLNDPKLLKPAAQPPRQFQIAVNLIVAEQLGVEIPESLTQRATFVYRPEK